MNKEADVLIQMFNHEQRIAFNEIIASVTENRGRLLYLDGPAGSRKTFVYRALISYLRGTNKTVIATATTGIAADLIDGRTLHSVMKLPVPVHENTVSNMKMGSENARKLREASLIIIDEVSMLSKHSLEAVDELLRRMVSSGDIFGGKVVLLGGDFRQTSNVILRGNRSSVYEISIKCSRLWRHARILRLSQNMRAADQEEFSNWLLDIGNGLADERSLVEIPQQYVAGEDIVNEIYGDVANMANSEDLTNRTILTTNNDVAKEINDRVLNLMIGNEVTYTSADSIVTEDNDVVANYPLEFLNKQQPSGMPPHKLILKRGALIMLLRNLDPANGLLNGTRLIIDELHYSYCRNRIQER